MAKTLLNLRKRIPISYFEPEEPNFDEYLYCEECSDYVYEYCAIHGHLLVVPDDKVPVRTKFPSYVPRAALTIPHVFLHLAPSIIPGAGLGVFSTLTLPRGVRFGPYCGQRTQDAESMYCWQIYSGNKKPSHVIDAADGNRSNWMRYVNCARHWREQNLLAYQYQGQLYYRTIKIIPRFTELMVFYGSEFANVLHINLSKYNCDKYYRDLQLYSTPFAVNKINTSISTKIFNDSQEKPINEYIENKFDDKTTQNIDKITKETTKLNESADNYPYKVHFDGDTIKIDFQLTEENGLTCEICRKVFAKKRYLNRHIKLHNRNMNENLEEQKQFSFQKCNSTTSVSDNFREHYRNHEKSETKKGKYTNIYLKPRKCEVCDFVTSSKKVFTTHMSKHKGNIYNCAHCEYCNHTKYNLSRHIFAKHRNLFNFGKK